MYLLGVLGSGARPQGLWSGSWGQGLEGHGMGERAQGRGVWVPGMRNNTGTFFFDLLSPVGGSYG